MTLVAGVDSSTQSCTVVLHDESGTMLASASAPHVWTTPPVSEQDPEGWWGALSEALAKACHVAGTSPRAISCLLYTSRCV